LRAIWRASAELVALDYEVHGTGDGCVRFTVGYAPIDPDQK